MQQALDILCPMHLILTEDGTIEHVGPTLRKICPGMLGRDVFQEFSFRRPRKANRMEEFQAVAGRRLLLKQARTGTPFCGVYAPMADGGGVLKLSFGINVVDGVRKFELTNADLEPTDLTIEMLYLIEAKSAAMEASRSLNQRLQMARISAESQAFTDTLTGLGNRRALEQGLTRLRAVQRNFALMHIDLDFFKQINDTHGHAAGDHVLQEASRRMLDETREEDSVTRIGGDEFTLIFDNLLDRTRLADIAQRLITAIEQPVYHGSVECRVSASIGIARSCDYGEFPVDDILEDADRALYQSKRAGRSQFYFAADLQEDEIEA